MANENLSDLKVLGFEQRGKMFADEMQAMCAKYGVVPVARLAINEVSITAIPGISDALEQPPAEDVAA